MAELGVSWDEVRLCEWRPGWAKLFEAESARIRSGCPGASVEHVGSTAVADLPAKPIIDMLVGVAPSELADTVAALQRLGYRTHSERERGDRTFLWLGDNDVSRYHVNVTLLGSGAWSSLLQLRELLRSDSRARERYAAEKRTLARRHAKDRMAYLQAKSRVIDELLQSAARVPDRLPGVASADKH